MGPEPENAQTLGVILLGDGFQLNSAGSYMVFRGDCECAQEMVLSLFFLLLLLPGFCYRKY